MRTKFFKIFILVLLTLFSIILVSAQSEQDKNDSIKKMDLPEGLQETLAKRKLKAEEKEFQELIKSGEDAVKLSEELSKSFAENQKLSAEDKKKLEKLEKIVKKIRQELGAEEDKEIVETPTTISNAFDNIKDKSANLLEELKKRTKFSISVVAVESSNTIWRLVKFLRLNKN